MKFTPARVGLLYFVIGFAFFTIAINSQTYGWLSWYRLYQSGQETQAVITRQQPEIHQRCFFKFTVNSRVYENWGDGCSTIPVGNEVPVTYLPADPSIVTLNSPGEELASLVFGPLVISLLAGLVGAWQTRARLRTRLKAVVP